MHNHTHTHTPHTNYIYQHYSTFLPYQISLKFWGNYNRFLNTWWWAINQPFIIQWLLSCLFVCLLFGLASLVAIKFYFTCQCIHLSFYLIYFVRNCSLPNQRTSAIFFKSASSSRFHVQLVSSSYFITETYIWLFPAQTQLCSFQHLVFVCIAFSVGISTNI